ncbi:hypothetical protein [Pseudomonas syringae]|uniref:hypothetical protein n=1 Tax=Pseudomonas syringae TaxID=317 RepID=UPI000B16A0C3|nr:hypothetical protein [Pseudomonas syringae]
MHENKYQRLPRAGDLEEKSGTEVFYLAPQPVPTGVTGFSSRNLRKESNATYLDFSLSSASIEFGVRGWIGSSAFVIIFFMVIGISLGLYDYVNYGRHPLTIALMLLSPNWFVWGVLGFISGINAWLFIRTIRLQTKYPPIRFNRQRREVAYVAKRGQPPRFVPWEEVIACVSSGKVVTQYGSHNSFSLMIGLRDSESGDVVWITVPTASLLLAVSEWEAIRSYMEEGLSALPPPMNEAYEEGTVAYFQLCRQAYRENHWYVTYLFGFVLIQFCSGWTLPCHIAAWVERLPKTSFPKSVLDWSKPLPPEQWQKPSAELIEQSKAVRKSLRQGKSLFEHFREMNKTCPDVQQVEIRKRANS